MRKKVKIIILNTVIVVTCIVVVSIFIIVSFSNKQLTPQEIYSKRIGNVVELKAYSNAVGESYGSAVIVDDVGTIVTNAHIITYSSVGELRVFDKYEIRFATSNDYIEVELVKYDEKLDLAVLKTKEVGDYQPIPFGSSNDLEVGDTVYAIGNALNYGISMTQGIVSIPLLRIEYDDNVRDSIQCNLVINEGNSGGALCDAYGKLVGITTFRTKDYNGNIVYGMAYCIPINVVIEYLSK